MVHPLIILYPPEQTIFSANGLGALNEDIVSCLVTEEGNGSFELEMVYPISGRRYSDITNRSIIFVKPNPVDPPQAFRIYEISKPMDGQVTYYAAHISYDLSGYPVKPFSASSCMTALSGLKTNSAVSHPFTFWTDKETSASFRVTAPISIRSALGGSEGSILDVFGGEYKFDNWVVRLYNHRGSDLGVTIRYGKNLTDFKQEENIASVYTAILPYWSQDNDVVLLPEMILSTGGTYNFNNVAILDFSSDFNERPLVADLRAKAQEYLKDNDLSKPNVSIDVSFEQLEQSEEYENLTLLERVCLFDTVSVIFEKLGVSATAKVSKTVYDAVSGKYTSITLGNIRSNLSDTILGQDAAIEEASSGYERFIETDLEKAVNNATSWITNGRGHMVAVKNEAGQWTEICSLDTTDINTATNVWRWNNGGFGHSSRGYSGPYTTAITQDGQIVANCITSGELNGSIIKAGIIQDKKGLNYWNMVDGTMKVTATELSITSGSNFKVNNKLIADYVNVDVLTQDSVFNKLTNNGAAQGIFLAGGQLFVNGYYIETTYLSTISADVGTLTGGTIRSNNYMASTGVTPVGDPKYTAQGFIIDLDNEIIRGRKIDYNGSDLFLGGTLKAAKGDFRGELKGVTGKIGGFEIGTNALSTLGSNYGIMLSNDHQRFVSGDEYYTVMDSTGFSGKNIYSTNLTVSGTKKRAVKTNNYLERSLYCYETSSPMFGDIGEAVTDDQGECYVLINDIFSETISNIEYQVFLQKEGTGDLWVEKKEPGYFLVKGASNLKFAWEIKAIQRDFELETLEIVDRDRVGERWSAETDGREVTYLNDLIDLMFEEEEKWSYDVTK